MEQFYAIEMGRVACNSQLHAGGQCVNAPRQRCPVCGTFPGPEPPEIEIALSHLGRQGFAEYLWNSEGLPILREDLIDLWLGAGLTGFALKPVRFVGWYENPRKPLPEHIPTYFRVVPTSNVRLTSPPPAGGPCPVCGFVAYAFPKLSIRLPESAQIDLASWDGSDMFGLAGYVFVFCVRRVAEVTLTGGYNRRLAFIRLENWRREEEFDIRTWTYKAYHDHVQGFLIRRAEDL